MQDLDSLCGVLNYGGSNRFAHLSGAFPLSSALHTDRDLAGRFYDFSLRPEDGTKAEEGSVCTFTSSTSGSPDSTDARLHGRLPV